MKWQIQASLPISYTIDIVKDVLDLNFLTKERKIVIADTKVYNLYKDKFPDCVLFTLQSGEDKKDISSVDRILNFFIENDVSRRNDPVVVIGGGVLLDLVGYCCSIYRRGIPYIRIPTTLLAIVDASVGVKTGVNYCSRRNRLGTYYPPLSTYIDIEFIKTQDVRQISNGVAEILKLAFVTDYELFFLLENEKSLIENRFQSSAGIDIIHRSIDGMIAELKDNLWEKNLQRSVDFGHSFSPWIEMKNIETLLHGEAVILDCLFSFCISAHKKMITESELKRVFDVVKKYGLKTYHQDFVDIDILLSALKEVMIHRNNNQYLPLPTGIGKHIIVNDITEDDIKKAIEIYETYSK